MPKPPLSGPDAGGSDRVRPLSARSVVASTLLGMSPPRLPGQLLVRSGEVFGIAEGTTRVALSRMVAAGELVADDGSYALAGPLLERHSRQSASRRAMHREWAGDWELAVVDADRRDAPSRGALRTAMRTLKLAELREGVWTRPDNLDAERFTEAASIVDAQCRRFTARPSDDAHALAAQLWGLDGWAREARSLDAQLRDGLPDLESGRTEHLAPAFVLSATVLRHLVADPELPAEVLPTDWPGDALRTRYDTYDATFKRVWRDWFRAQHP